MAAEVLLDLCMDEVNVAAKFFSGDNPRRKWNVLVSWGRALRLWKECSKFLWKYRQIATVSYVIATPSCYVIFPKTGSNPFFYFGHCSPTLRIFSLVFMSFSVLKTFFSPSLKSTCHLYGCRHKQLSFSSQLQSQFTSFHLSPTVDTFGTWEHSSFKHNVVLFKILVKMQRIKSQNWWYESRCIFYQHYPIELSAMKEMLSAVSNMAGTDDIQYWALK